MTPMKTQTKTNNYLLIALMLLFLSSCILGQQKKKYFIDYVDGEPIEKYIEILEDPLIIKLLHNNINITDNDTNYLIIKTLVYENKKNDNVKNLYNHILNKYVILSDGAISDILSPEIYQLFNSNPERMKRLYSINQNNSFFDLIGSEIVLSSEDDLYNIDNFENLLNDGGFSREEISKLSKNLIEFLKQNEIKVVRFAESQYEK